MPTVYINGWETEARMHDGTLELRRLNHETEKYDSQKVPLFDIDRAVIVGRPVVTVPVLQRFAGEGIPVAFVTSKGRWLAGLYPDANGHALRRLKQYELAGNRGIALRIAGDLIAAKVRNMRRVLQRLASNRARSGDREHVTACSRLEEHLTNIGDAESLDEARGYEGAASAVYFKQLSHYFTDDIPFAGRNRQPPKDEANALLSWTYTIVLGEVDAAIRAAGLDPCLGFLHEISYGRPSLSLDLMEPLRAPLCDLLVLDIVNHKRLKRDDFEFNSENGGTYLKPDARKTFFRHYERTMQRRFAAGKGEPHTDFRAVIRDQVNTVLRYLENREHNGFFQMP
ncbi:MAG: CRISPR-associated endonuclease Cas1 [Candidatus Pacebacteria bacterium]|nr:CRISPR-associated endonuclease Cas1 [Candidatus Paceibacterota bacterium]